MTLQLYLLIMVQSVKDGMDLLNNDSATTKGILLALVFTLGVAVRYLYVETKQLREENRNLQDTFRKEILDISEKSISSLSNFEKGMFDSSSTISEKVLNNMKNGHEKILVSIQTVKDRLNEK